MLGVEGEAAKVVALFLCTSETLSPVTTKWFGIRAVIFSNLPYFLLCRYKHVSFIMKRWCAWRESGYQCDCGIDVQELHSIIEDIGVGYCWC